MQIFALRKSHKRSEVIRNNEADDQINDDDSLLIVPVKIRNNKYDTRNLFF